MDLLALLKRVEWADHDERQPTCQDCGGTKPHHTQTCELEAAIDALKAGEILISHGNRRFEIDLNRPSILGYSVQALAFINLPDSDP